MIRGLDSKIFILILLVIIFSGNIIALDFYAPEKIGPYQSKSYEDSFNNSRGTYKITVYYPTTIKNSTSPYPAVVFSPGFMGGRENYIWIGQHLASHGFIVMTYSIPFRFDILMNSRIDGFQTAIEYLDKKNGDPNNILYNKIDMNNLGIGGHSYGAGATMMYLAKNDKRIKAGVGLSTYCTMVLAGDTVFPDLNFSSYSSNSSSESMNPKEMEKIMNNLNEGSSSLSINDYAKYYSYLSKYMSNDSASSKYYGEVSINISQMSVSTTPGDPYAMYQLAWQQIKKITIPTQIQTGDHDGLNPETNSWRCYGLIDYPTKEGIEITGADHLQFCNANAQILNLIMPPSPQYAPTISLDEQQRLSSKYFTSFFYYFLKNDLRYEPYIHGQKAQEDLSLKNLSQFEEKIGCEGSACIPIIETNKQCYGCFYNNDTNTCFAFGSKKTINSFIYYCGNDGNYHQIKGTNDNCVDHYECLSYKCRNGKCTQIDSRSSAQDIQNTKLQELVKMILSKVKSTGRVILETIRKDL